MEFVMMKAVEAANILGVDKSTIHRWVKAGKIECIRIERNSVYFTQDQIDEFIDRHRKRYEPALIG